VFFHEYSVYFLKKNFTCAKIILLYIIFCSYFFGQNCGEFTILFGNIYKWSRALMKFYKDFFSTNLMFIVSYNML